MTHMHPHIAWLINHVYPATGKLENGFLNVTCEAGVALVVWDQPKKTQAEYYIVQVVYSNDTEVKMFIIVINTVII